MLVIIKFPKDVRNMVDVRMYVSLNRGQGTNISGLVETASRTVSHASSPSSFNQAVNLFQHGSLLLYVKARF